MDEVVLHRRGFGFSLDRPLQLAGYALGFAGAVGLAYLLGGREILTIFPVWIVMIVAFSLYPMKVLIADRDGVSILSRGGRSRTGTMAGSLSESALSRTTRRAPVPGSGWRR